MAKNSESMVLIRSDLRHQPNENVDECICIKQIVFRRNNDMYTLYTVWYQFVHIWEHFFSGLQHLNKAFRYYCVVRSHERKKVIDFCRNSIVLSENRHGQLLRFAKNSATPAGIKRNLKD